MVLIDNDIGTIRANYERVQATKAARELQEKALDAEQKKLENGKSTTYIVLQVQRDLTDARGQEIQALDEYNKSLATLPPRRLHAPAPGDRSRNQVSRVQTFLALLLLIFAGAGMIKLGPAPV